MVNNHSGPRPFLTPRSMSPRCRTAYLSPPSTMKRAPCPFCRALFRTMYADTRAAILRDFGAAGRVDRRSLQDRQDGCSQEIDNVDFGSLMERPSSSPTPPSVDSYKYNTAAFFGSSICSVALQETKQLAK